MKSRTSGGPAAALALVLALVLALEPHAAQAAATLLGSASIGNFSYRLVDLTPDDGIAPWMYIEPSYGARNSYLENYDAPGYRSRDMEVLGFPGQTVTIEKPGVFVLGSVQGDTYSIRIDIGVNSADAFAGNAMVPFVLAPNTMVIFSADASAALDFDPSQGTMSADLGLTAYRDDPGNLADPLYGRFRLDRPGELSSPVSLSVSAGSAGFDGRLDFGAYLRASVSPVPEPGQPAMALAGLAMILARMRGRAPGKDRLREPG